MLPNEDLAACPSADVVRTTLDERMGFHRGRKGATPQTVGDDARGQIGANLGAKSVSQYVESGMPGTAVTAHGMIEAMMTGDLTGPDARPNTLRRF